MKCLAEVLYEIVPFAWVGMITLQAVAFIFLDRRSQLVQTVVRCGTVIRITMACHPTPSLPLKITSLLLDSTLFGKLCVHSF